MAVNNKVYILYKAHCDSLYDEYKNLVLGVFIDIDKIRNAIKTVSIDILNDLNKEYNDPKCSVFDNIESNKPNWRVYLPYRDLEIELFYEECFLNTL